MISYGYLIVGIIYVLIAIFYMVYTALFTQKYNQIVDEYIWFNRIRYGVFSIFYLALGIIYIISHFGEEFH